MTFSGFSRFTAVAGDRPDVLSGEPVVVRCHEPVGAAPLEPPADAAAAGGGG